MTNSVFRGLMLAAVAAACASFSTSSNADEAVRAVSDIEKASAIQIVPGVPQAGEAVQMVIAPAVQTPVGLTVAFEDEGSVLATPYEETESDNAKPKPRKKRAMPSDRATHASKKKETAKARSAVEKPVEKKPVATPLAKETASEKARAEWQRKRALKNAHPKTEKAAADKAVRSASAAKKRAILANGPSTAEASASARASKSVAMKTGQLASQTTRKDSRSYREIYDSIPFRRAEYDANPAYRHQATMEIMLGQLHPIIVAPGILPPQETRRDITVRFLPSIRPGYRPYSRYPWH